MSPITLAIDAMGGDHGLKVVIPACIAAVQQNARLNLLLVGHKDQIHMALEQHQMASHPQLSIVHAEEVVTMDDLPSYAVRSKKKSSMRIAIDLVKNGQAEACVSAGNTGALMATARFVLKTLPGIDRPAIIASLPTIKGKTLVIDLGANVDSNAEHLFQFALMGSALIQAVNKKPTPNVALLNIGVEEIKGNEQVKQTAQRLAQCPFINYVGYVEGDQLYSGDVDLIVCDGFVGNVALKSSEGLAKFMMSILKESFSKNPLTRFIGLLSMPVLKTLKKRMDPARYNGASLLGLNGIVIKSHGGANALAFQNAIEEAMVEVKSNVIDLVRAQMADLFKQTNQSTEA